MGGDIRVSQLTIANEFDKIFKTKYIYTLPDNTSSGVVSKEPELIRDSNNPNNFGLDNIYDYPTTPVLYSRVVVQTGYSQNSSDYTVKQVFEFEAPNKNMVVENTTMIEDQLVPDFHYRTANDLVSDQMYFKQYQHKIDIKTAPIGKIKSITTLDKNDVVAEVVSFDYTENTPSDQGKYTSGTLLSEVASRTSNFLDPHVMKLIKTTKTYYPYALAKITHSKDGFTSTKEYTAWDFFTGLPTTMISTSPSNLKIRQEISPAYSVEYLSGSTPVKLYETMGLKGFNSNNKNMVSQVAATYTYQADENGLALSLISAVIQTWKKDWANYRHFDGSNYVDFNETTSANNPVWRKGSSYVWTGDYGRLRDNGTHNFSNSDQFNFSPAASNPLWLYAGETTRFDHFGMPLESKNRTNIYSSVKMGYGDQTVIASAGNARFNEIAFSSAEDLYSDKPFFGAEVALANGEVRYLSKGQTSATHTGDAVVSLSSGNAFVFKTSDLFPNKRYRSSVWTNDINGRIYYKINDGSEVLSVAPSSAKLVNGWYRIDIDLPVQTASFSLEIGVKSTGGEVHFDDFRFQPSDASMTCYVYPPLSFDFTDNPLVTSNFNYTLNNDNLYTKFEHNEKGFLMKTYQESITYGVKLISENKLNYRRSIVNP